MAWARVETTAPDTETRGPYLWTGVRADDVATEARRDADCAKVEAEIQTLKAGRSDVVGEISTPLPTGASVPHSDVMRILDAFLAAEIQEVNFEGSPGPAPRGDGVPK